MDNLIYTCQNPLTVGLFQCCSIFPNSLEVTSTTKDCVMEGSQHVQQLGLHDRYNLDVRIVLSWTDTSSGPTLMETDGNIMVEVSSR